MSHSYRDKTVVITGACAGIGRALSQRFGMAGAHVALIDLNREQIATCVDHLESRGVQARGYRCDVSDQKGVHETMNRIMEDFQRIDVLINNAGITHRSLFEDTAAEVHHRLMAINYFGALYCTREALPALLDSHGLVITMSSMSGFAPLQFRSAYCASKHALHGLFNCLRVELMNRGVDIMMVCPGFTATDIYKNALQGDGGIVKKPFTLSGKAASPADVAEEAYVGAVKRKRLLLLSNVDWRVRLFARFFPVFFERYLAHRIGGI